MFKKIHEAERILLHTTNPLVSFGGQGQYHSSIVAFYKFYKINSLFGSNILSVRGTTIPFRSNFIKVP